MSRIIKTVMLLALLVLSGIIEAKMVPLNLQGATTVTFKWKCKGWSIDDNGDPIENAYIEGGVLYVFYKDGTVLQHSGDCMVWRYVK